jgi:integrase
MEPFRKPGSKVYTYEFQFNGQRIRESSGTRNLALARTIMRSRRTELEEGRAGIVRTPPPGFFSAEAAAFMERRETAVDFGTLGRKTYKIDECALKHLEPVFGKKLLTMITDKDIVKYQQARLDEEAAPKSINLEMGTLRAILVRGKQWDRLKDKVRMLPTEDEMGRCVTTEEEKALLEACAKSNSPLVLPFVTLALYTGARFGTIRTLQWKRVSFDQRCLTWGKDKTPAGSGRTVPLNSAALAAMKRRATDFPDRKPTDYVFPAKDFKVEEAGISKVKMFWNPEKPVGEVKEAWEGAKERAGKALGGDKTPPLVCRFHDLRHTAVSRMVEAGVPLTIVAKIVGWSASTLAKMVLRYSHFQVDTLRDSMEKIVSQSQGTP